MTTKTLWILGTTLVGVVVGAFLLGRWHLERLAAIREFEELFTKDGKSHISSITFSGQQRAVTVTEPEVLSRIEECMRGTRSVAATGTAYDVLIRFRSGREAHSGFYIYDDLSGFTVANDYKKRASDPEYIGIKCPEPVDRKLVGLFQKLTDRSAQ